MSSNVHRLGDYSNESNQQQQPQRQAFPAMGGGQRVPPQYGQQGQGQGPGPQQRQQQMFFIGDDSGGGGMSPYPPLNKVLAPHFNRATFIFWITIIQICVFIAELFVGQFKYDGAFVSSNDMAGPSGTTLKNMGGKYLPCIQNGEIFRFITPAFLHSGVLHIFTNLVVQTMIGYSCERQWGFWRMCSFYFATTFGATLLSCVGSACSVSVGASGALLGVMGAHIAWILLNWANREKILSPCQRMCTMIIWLFIIFIIGIGSSNIDNYAHLGGLISGLLLGFAFNEATAPVSWMIGAYRYVRYVCMFLSVAYFASTLLSSFFAISTSSCSAC